MIMPPPPKKNMLFYFVVIFYNTCVIHVTLIKQNVEKPSTENFKLNYLQKGISTNLKQVCLKSVKWFKSFKNKILKDIVFKVFFSTMKFILIYTMSKSLVRNQFFEFV